MLAAELWAIVGLGATCLARSVSSMVIREGFEWYQVLVEVCESERQGDRYPENGVGGLSPHSVLRPPRALSALSARHRGHSMTVIVLHHRLSSS